MPAAEYRKAYSATPTYPTPSRDARQIECGAIALLDPARMGPVSGAQPPSARRRVLHIASACATRQAFVSVFGRYCDGEAIFVATRSPRASGEELSFRITLAGGEPIIVASGRVDESYRDGEGPHGRAGMLIRFTDIDPASRGVILELTAHRPVNHAHYGSDAGDGLEIEHATRPSGLPRSLGEPSSTRTTITAGSGIVPPPPGPLTFKPEATPPPAFEPGAPHSVDDEGPTGIKSMQSVAAMSRSGRAARGTGHEAVHEFHDEPSWGERGDFFGDGDGRAEAAARMESTSDALAECTVYEESEPAALAPVHHDELGQPPALLKRSSNMSSNQNDAWDDETLPPWLRGPAPDEDLDAATGSDDQDLLSQAAITGVAESLEPKGVRPDLSEPMPSVALSSSFEREALAAVAAEAARVGQRRRWPLVLGAAALSGVLGLVGGYAIGAGGYLPLATVVDDGEPGASAKTTWSAQTPPPSAQDPSAQDPFAQDPSAQSPAPPPDTSAVAAAVVADDEDEDEGDDEPGDAAGKGKEERHNGEGKRAKRTKLRSDRCGVDVKTDPDGAEVLVAGQVMGTTPARFELPCGQHEVVVRRSRYADETRKVRLRAGKLDKVDVRLERPDHKLRIISAPLGATVTVNGKPAGTTPLVATVKGYQGNRVRIERPGFETWSRKVYAKEPLTRLTVKLTPEKGSAAAAARSSVESAAQPAASATPSTPILSAPAPDAGGG
jgi:hypothetical protein